MNAQRESDVRTPTGRSGTRRTLSVCASVLTFVMVACSQAPSTERETQHPQPTPIGTPVGEITSITIGPAGGSLFTRDRRLTVTVPPGALTTPTELSVQAIRNETPHGLGVAYRLKPEGISLQQPATVSFTFTDVDLTRTSPGGLGIATQDGRRVWRGQRDVQVDRVKNTVSTQTTHFSDWSLFEAFVMTPTEATVKTNQTVALTVEHCVGLPNEREEDLMAPLTVCQPFEMAPLIDSPAVNGVAGGDSSVGTISRAEGTSVLTFTAPSEVPPNNPVAVSVEVDLLGKRQLTLVSHITVQRTPCTQTAPLEPCRSTLAKVNGKPLPYEDIPRDSWENRELLTKASLLIDDADADGSGNWNIRYEWTEERAAGTLSQFMQIGGTFKPGTAPNTLFSLPSGDTFSGRLVDAGATLEDVPLSTKNATFTAKLEFVR